MGGPRRSRSATARPISIFSTALPAPSVIRQSARQCLEKLIEHVLPTTPACWLLPSVPALPGGNSTGRTASPTARRPMPVLQAAMVSIPLALREQGRARAAFQRTLRLSPRKPAGLGSPSFLAQPWPAVAARCIASSRAYGMVQPRPACKLAEGCWLALNGSLAATTAST